MLLQLKVSWAHGQGFTCQFFKPVLSFPSNTKRLKVTMNTNKGSISCLLYYHFWHGTHGMIIILVLLQYVRQCVEQGGKINEYSNDGMTFITTTLTAHHVICGQHYTHVENTCMTASYHKEPWRIGSIKLA
jgi:hypothetical protein